LSSECQRGDVESRNSI